jgi:DNA-binding GntR family transcriptional regulator
MIQGNYSAHMATDDESDPRAYMRIAAIVRRRIEDGTYEVGQPVPSITRLVQEHGVARITAAHALRVLEEQGYVRRYPGLGYYVVERRSQ